MVHSVLYLIFLLLQPIGWPGWIHGCAATPSSYEAQDDASKIAIQQLWSKHVFIISLIYCNVELIFCIPLYPYDIQIHPMRSQLFSTRGGPCEEPPSTVQNFLFLGAMAKSIQHEKWGQWWLNGSDIGIHIGKKIIRYITNLSTSMILDTTLDT